MKEDYTTYPGSDMYNKPAEVASQPLNALLCCPFCGCDAKLKRLKAANIDGAPMALIVSVQCTSIDCGAEGPVFCCQSEQYDKIDQLPTDAVAAWNKRAC